MVAGLYSFLEALGENLFLAGYCLRAIYSHLLSLHLSDWPFCLSLLFLRAHMIRLSPPRLIQVHLPISKSVTLITSAKFLLLHKITYSKVAGIHAWRSFAGLYSAYCSNHDHPHPAKTSIDHREQLSWPRSDELHIGPTELWETVNAVLSQ